MKLRNFVNPSADSAPKIGHDFSSREVQKWKYVIKKKLLKNCAPILVFFIEKKRFE